MSKKPRKKVTSYSQYSMWSNCPAQWDKTYIQKIMKGDPSIHTVFGSAMHDTIQQWLDVVFNRSMLMARTMDLGEILKDRLIVHFKRETTGADDNKVYVCDKQTLMEFYDDGVAILTWLQMNLERFFSVMEWSLEGIETRLNVEVKPNVFYRGYLDIVLRHKLTGAIKIIDLKTSTKGWGKWKKDDPVQRDQLLLYKLFYANKYDIPEDTISVDFYILRRKLPEHSDWPIPRVSRFTPSNGKPSMNKMKKRFKNFLDTAYDSEGQFVPNQEHTPSEHACRFCPYVDTEHCEVGIPHKD